ncbi:hypothetical protein D3C77_178510 [compost metagenome]
MANVEVDVEQVILHPVGVAQAEGHLDDLALEHRRDVQALADMLDDLPKAQVLPLDRGLVVDVDHGAVRRGMGTIDVQEQGVLPAQFAHRESSRRVVEVDWLNPGS